MKLERTKNAKRNLIWSIGNRFVSLVLPFINRTVFIYVLGVEYLGLNSLYASILQILSLAELGIGNAVVYHMYKPIANDDTKQICALLGLYRRIYRWIGLIILGIGLLIMPFLSNMINGDIPDDVNLYSVFLIYLLNTVISYWCYIYKSSIANAMQRVDIVVNVNTITQVFLFVGQVSVLYFTQNYYLYIVIMPVSTLLNNILLSRLVDKYFPQYKCGGEVPGEIIQDLKKKVLGLFIQKGCAATRNALDSICISYFIGLSIAGIYNNYYYVVLAATSIFGIVSSAIVAGVGNSMALNSVEKNYADMRRLDFVYMIFSGVCTAVLLNVFQPFMYIWVGDSMMFPFVTVVLMTMYFYVLKTGDVRSVYSTAAGLWWEHRYRSIAETICNVILNILGGMYYGVNGILAATLISLFCINFCWGSHIVFGYYFRGINITEYFINHTKYMISTIVLSYISYECCQLVSFDCYIELLFNFIMTIVIMIAGYWGLFHHTNLYSDSKKWFMERIGTKKGVF